MPLELGAAARPTDLKIPPLQTRARRTRAEILSAASDQFDSLGYAQTSINSVLAAGTLTKGAIYFHFSSKEAIAHQFIEAWIQCVHQTVAQTDKPVSPTTHLRNSLSKLAHQIAVDKQLRVGMKLTLEPSIDNGTAFISWVETVNAIVQTAVTAGELEDNAITRRLAWNLCAGLIGTAHAHTIKPDGVSLAVRIDDAIIALLGLAGTPHTYLGSSVHQTNRVTQGSTAPTPK